MLPALVRSPLQAWCHVFTPAIRDPVVNKTVILPTQGWASVDFRELLRYRELLYFLTWRDIKVRYKQTVLGAAWAVLQPALTMIIFTVFFGRMANIPSEGVPYPIFSYAGLLPWFYFANAVTFSSNSLIGDARLINKVYFPRLFIPMGSTLAGLLDYSISTVLLVVIMGYYGMVPDAGILLLPLLMVFCFMAATGAGMLTAALNVQYRDIRYAIPFLMQLWLFLTPVIYPSSMLSPGYQWVMALNPMAGLVEAHRAAVLPDTTVDWTSLGTSVAVATALFVVGVLYFKRVERSFADVI